MAKQQTNKPSSSKTSAKPALIGNSGTTYKGRLDPKNPGVVKARADKARNDAAAAAYAKKAAADKAKGVAKAQAAAKARTASVKKK